jgi:ureidoacrylate peracid hydrolase
MSQLFPLGRSAANQWRVNDVLADCVRRPLEQRPIEVDATPQRIRVDLARTALLVVDMQNDFCHPEGWLGSIGVDVSPGRRVISAVKQTVDACRTAGMPVIWVSWGNRPDLLNLGPSTHHVYNRNGRGTGLGDPLTNGAPVLQAGSWAAAIIDEFGDTSNDIHVAKFSMSGFWDTPLDAILRNLGVSTLLFAGVNLDQCVLCTLQDASFRGYDCVLLDDCCATTSPHYCAEATLYNVRQCFGFVSHSKAFFDTTETA